MRPINRGPLPRDNNGDIKEFKNYQSIRGDLLAVIGEYCCYCNQKLPSALAVEHVQPKSRHPDLELVWDNLLLACPNCNSHKGQKHVIVEDYLWPDLHNTHLAYSYHEDGRISVNDLLPESLREKAQNLLTLVGLQVYASVEGTASDRRWMNRLAAIKKSKDALALYLKCKVKGAQHEAAMLVAGWAPDSGFFSIWLETFKNEALVRKALIASYKGTAMDAFSLDGLPIKRDSQL